VRRKTTDSVNLMQRVFLSYWMTIFTIDHVLPDLQCVPGWAKIRHDRDFDVLVLCKNFEVGVTANV
jgi:hypothetical protein